MLLTTTDSLEGYRIERYLGIVGGEAVEWSWGGTGKQRLHESIQHAVNDLRRVAVGAGANAIVGVSIDHEQWNGSRFVVAYGTGVVVVPTKEPPPVLPPAPPPPPMGPNLQ